MQVNGKLRSRMEVPTGATEEAVREVALSEVNVQRHLEGKTIRKVIHIPDRLLNIVVS